MMNNYIQPVEFIQSQIGPMFYPANDKYVGGALRETGIYSPSEYKLIESIVSRKPGMMCLDIGANIGAITLAMKKGFVVAFEPQYFIYQLLKANLALNEAGQAVNGVVGEEVGEVEIPIYNYQSHDNYGALSHKDWSGEGVKTKVYTIDSILEGRPVHFIKIDVEGMEMQVLRGGKKSIGKYRPILWVENDKDNSPELIEYIKGINYTPYWVITLVTEQEGASFNNQASFNMLCVPKERTNFTVQGFREAQPEHSNKQAQGGEIFMWRETCQK